ncbi:PepSY domain-containing protein [Pseudoalteromonas sp. JBTF-M23]|uniref:PepSY domain-containing protein n=1 Tax=Pseudoalteromonas caenipelagi TaxID=2726988 RepID=A0A849VK24_9GAMM|nr:PepSY domain-containing protein [Pseudoalteromonas caenipelagi]NOU51967.1 PepSY domain-containing protein [Pseudoalteromonas caenipelagi]
MIRTIRKYHKWLMAFIGAQFFIWSLTGLYMVTMDIHYIHGESLQRQSQQPIALNQVNYSLSKLLSEYPGAQQITLTQLLAKPVYHFIDKNHTRHLLDAQTGQLLPLIDKLQVLKIAKHQYTGDDAVASVLLITNKSELPSELAPRHLPVWQVVFDNVWAPTFYISQNTGTIVTKRHFFWRLFDWMWRFHIMDYDDGENVANWFLLLIALLGTLAAVFGATLTYQRVFKPNNQGAN